MLSPLYTCKSWPTCMELQHHFNQDEREILHDLGVYHITFMLEIKANQGFLTTLVKDGIQGTTNFNYQLERLQ